MPVMVPKKGAHRVGVDAKPKDPCLGTWIIGGWSGVKGHGQTLPWLKWQGFEGAPAPMALKWLGNLKVVLWFPGYPSMCPQWFFQWILKALSPFHGHGCMALVVVPGAHPDDVLWCGWDPTQGARLGLVPLAVMDGGLVWCRPKCVARPCRSAIRYLGASPWPSKPQKATGWTPPLWSLSLVRMLGSLRLRSLIRLCLFFLNLCWRVAMRLLLPAE